LVDLCRKPSLFLYMLLFRGGENKVIDLGENKVIDLLKTEYWISNIRKFGAKGHALAGDRKTGPPSQALFLSVG